MRAVALLLLPSLAFAAPVPKLTQKSTLDLTLAAENQLVLEVTIQNNGSEPLELSYGESPLDLVVVELRGAKGKQYKIQQTDKKVDQAERGILKIPAGKSETLSFHTCHFLPEVVEGGEAVTFTARMKYDGKTIESKPLTVK